MGFEPRGLRAGGMLRAARTSFRCFRKSLPPVGWLRSDNKSNGGGEEDEGLCGLWGWQQYDGSYGLLVVNDQHDLVQVEYRLWHKQCEVGGYSADLLVPQSSVGATLPTATILAVPVTVMTD